MAAGIGWDVPALTINKMCLSGIDAIALADQLIRAGEFDVVVAGGQESMTKAPHLLMDSRAGYKYGDVTVLDHMAYDGLHDVFTDQPMGALTEQRNDVDKFTRARAGRVRRAARTRRRPRPGRTACSPTRSCRCTIPQRKGDPMQFTEDEGIRANTTAESLGGLKPAFRKDGTITAGSASQISDGACRRRRDEQGEGAGAGADVAVPRSVPTAWSPGRIRRCSPSRPTPSRRRSPGRASRVDQLDVMEINEAFAAVALASTRELGVDPEKVNRQRRRHRGRATRSACRARGSRCMPPWSWPAAAPATALPRCAVPVARATR